ncbi:hypothetical protein V3G39_17910 (plasmid) [Dermatophilaceae bacterium Sec6.4]
MDSAVIAAWIGAATAITGTVATIVVGAKTSSRQQDFEQAVQAAQRDFERQQVRFADQRDAYRDFLVPAETLIDVLGDQYIKPGKISKFEKDVEMRVLLAPEEPREETVNPLPVLAPDSEEAVSLRQLMVETRTQRVRIALMGPPEVAQAALNFERSVRTATRAVLSREPTEARDSFIEAAGAHEEFLDKARLTLGDNYRGGS